MREELMLLRVMFDWLMKLFWTEVRLIMLTISVEFWIVLLVMIPSSTVDVSTVLFWMLVFSMRLLVMLLVVTELVLIVEFVMFDPLMVLDVMFALSILEESMSLWLI